jgi:1,4-alpha-glucan branching enzyme
MATALAVAAVLVLATVVVVRQTPREAARETVLTVKLAFYAPQAKRVAVAGDFNLWQPDKNTMVRRDGGVWTVDIPLRPGVYSYMFVVDGTAWVTDPDAESFQDDGFGNRNAVVRVRI